MKREKRVLITLAIFILTAIPSGYCLVKQVQENEIMNDYLEANGLSHLPLAKESAFLVARQVIKDFNVNERTFKGLEMTNRPFLREDAGFLLSHKEGQCGEGSRVIIRLLNTLGFDATLISLYDKYIQSAHTLVSVKLSGDEFWVNSINSHEEITSFLENNNMSAKKFDHLYYSDNIHERIEKIERFSHSDLNESFSD